MPAKPPKSNLVAVKQWQRSAARDYYLRHPDASIADVARETRIGIRTVARAREVLVKEGLLPAGRNAGTPAETIAAAKEMVETLSITTPVETDEPEAPEEPAPPKNKGGRPRKDSASLLDDAAMREMAQMLDDLGDSEDVEETRKRLLKQTQRFVFDPSLHPDTRMSASQLWTKLVDMARAKDLGPGKPLTLAEAIERCADFLRACGPAVYVAAFNLVLGPEPPQASNLTVETTTTASSEAEAVQVTQVPVIETQPEGPPTPPPPPEPPPPTAASPWS